MSSKTYLCFQALRACQVVLNSQARYFSSQKNTEIICRACSALQGHSSHLLSSHQFRYKSSSTDLDIATASNMSEDKPSGQTTHDSMQREFHHTNVGLQEGWISVGQYKVFAWSVSGVESCVVIKSEDLSVVFDMGISIAESVRVPNVFITHGHIDHIGAVASHVAKRGLYAMKPARYFVPPHLVEPLQTVMRASYKMAQTVEALEDVNIVAAEVDHPIRINARYFIKVFPTIHRVQSQGYIVYKEERKLKDEYKGMEGFDVAALHRQGTDIHDVIITPEIAYTGDTVFEVFTNPPNPDLLKVKLLITEATFLDDDIGKNMMQKAKERGHIHLAEIAENAQLFDDVGHIILVHFSNKYSPKYILDCIRNKLPAELRSRVTPATVAKATIAATS